MTREDILILHSLMREHEDVLGSSRCTLLALGAFMASVQELACPPDQLHEQFMELIEAIKKTRPKVIPLIHLIEEFEKEMEPHYGQDPETAKQMAVELLHAKYDKLQAKSGKIIELGLTCIEQGDTIVMHAANANIIGIITLANQVLSKDINVIVLQQNLAKTKRMISQLRQSDVKLHAVPEYSLSHYIGKADKMFCAALSLTLDHQVVAPVGTANIASLCHFHQVPVYLFANTLKFAHGISADQRIHSESVTQDKHDQAYELITYSHCLVDLKMIDFLITEEGIYPKDKIKSYLDDFYRLEALH